MTGFLRYARSVSIGFALALVCAQALPADAASIRGRTPFGVENRAVLELFETPRPTLIRHAVISREPLPLGADQAVEVAFGAGSRWSIDASRCAADWQNQLCPEVTRADLGTGAIEARIALQAVALAYGEDGLWAINAGDTGATYISSDQCELAFVDPVVNEVTRRFDLPGGCERQAQARTIPPIELFVAAGSAWGVFQSPYGPLVKRMDLSSGELTAQITLRNAEQVLTADRDGLLARRTRRARAH